MITKTKVFLMITLLLVLYGCGKKEQKTQLQQPGEKIKLVYTYWGDTQEMAVVDKYVDAFEKSNPDIKIQKMHIAGQRYSDKFLTMCASGLGPDVFYIPPNDIVSYIDKGLLLELDDLIKNDKNFNMDDYLPGVFEPYKHNGKLYGVPRADQTLVIYFNKDLFDKSKLKYPDENWTWDDFFEICKKLTKDTDGDGKIDEYGYAIPICWWGFYLSIIQKGGQFFNKDLTKCLIDTPEVINILQWWQDFALKYKLSPILMGNQAGTHEMFYTGKVAMYPMGMWVVAEFNKMIKNFKWDICMFPKNSDGRRPTLAFYAGWGINKNSKHIDAAWRFVKFIAGKEGQTIVVEAMHDVPPLKSIAYSDKFLTPNIPPEHDKVFLDMMKDRVYFPLHPKIGEMSDIWRDAFESMFVSGGKPVKEICIDAAKRINKLLKEK